MANCDLSVEKYVSITLPKHLCTSIELNSISTKALMPACFMLLGLLHWQSLHLLHQHKTALRQRFSPATLIQTISGSWKTKAGAPAFINTYFCHMGKAGSKEQKSLSHFFFLLFFLIKRQATVKFCSRSSGKEL